MDGCKLFSLFMLIVGFMLGVLSSEYIYKHAFRKYTEEVVKQYKKALGKKNEDTN